MGEGGVVLVMKREFSSRVRAITASVASLALMCGLSLRMPAQELKPTAGNVPDSPSGLPWTGMKSSQGVPFVEVPGTPVLFAVWETRVGDYAAFVRESGYKWEQKTHFPQSDDHPVVNVSMRDALAYCNWLTKREQDSGALNSLQSYRLPTRKEWDAAAGLASGRKADPLAVELEEDKQKFPWGREWPPSAQVGNLNFAEISNSDDGYVYTAPVGRFAPSAEGVYDLAGNVWEWTWDRETQSESAGVLRGGSWMYFRRECLLSSYLYEAPAYLRAPSIGFRCVLEDKRRSAAFLARMRQSVKESEEKNRTAVAGASVSPEAVQRMREEIEEGTRAKSTGSALPDPSTLKRAEAGTPHLNSLGMILRPLGEGSSVLIGAHEVRVQDHEAAMTALQKRWTRKPAYSYRGDYPIVNVTWTEAVEFCDWLTAKERAAGLIGPQERYRLPSDLEWSRAAGLTDETGDSPESRHLGNKEHFPWGSDPIPPSRSANLDTARMEGYQDNNPHAAPVGSFTPNGLQIHDLAGNVAEWCGDTWNSTSNERVVRGSSWLTSSRDDLLTSSRNHLPESTARPELGFRVVLELAKP